MKTIKNVAAILLVVTGLFTMVALAMAQVQDKVTPVPGIAPPQIPSTAAPWSGKGFGAGLGAGLVMIGAGLGFGRIGAAALESMARQPEVAGKVQTAMIIIAALLEGATFFGLIVCISIPPSW